MIRRRHYWSEWANSRCCGAVAVAGLVSLLVLLPPSLPVFAVTSTQEMPGDFPSRAPLGILLRLATCSEGERTQLLHKRRSATQPARPNVARPTRSNTLLRANFRGDGGDRAHQCRFRLAVSAGVGWRAIDPHGWRKTEDGKKAGNGRAWKKEKGKSKRSIIRTMVGRMLVGQLKVTMYKTTSYSTVSERAITHPGACTAQGRFRERRRVASSVLLLLLHTQFVNSSFHSPTRHLPTNQAHTLLTNHSSNLLYSVQQDDYFTASNRCESHYYYRPISLIHRQLDHALHCVQRRQRISEPSRLIAVENHPVALALANGPLANALPYYLLCERAS
ncbi:hypothetical protein BU24DRAFT_454398 [Aaosphaeria arxii CBS 175.79]|uniref:Uncharacterized protein n=1 Tax=Aaosphaeria arxii CBS 175.79 TaxID=1450172 RepID=A0A6A5XD55_9PLEO|nr:uncharacterized protein BU24DRAFT_454398 [Aaosphaeria arxii CBS 175.79]KAF2010849.1 hypothetical protein BU24DRAFT_454398 [Aaosphaeria arxii CBS 175.79]